MPLFICIYLYRVSSFTPDGYRRHSVVQSVESLSEGFKRNTESSLRCYYLPRLGRQPHSDPSRGISNPDVHGLVVYYIVAIIGAIKFDVTWVRFPLDAIVFHHPLIDYCFHSPSQHRRDFSSELNFSHSWATEIVPTSVIK